VSVPLEDCAAAATAQAISNSKNANTVLKRKISFGKRFNITQQAVVRRNPNCVLRPTLFECFVDVRLRKGGIGP
jgi:hypothetical protein